MLDASTKSPITVAVTSGRPSTIRVELHFSSDAASEGLYHLQTPNCTACCAGMQNLATVRLLNATGSPAYNPTFSIDRQARVVSLLFNTTVQPEEGELLAINLEDAQWPQCALYNSAQLPALPMRAIAAIPPFAAEDRSRTSPRAATAHQRLQRF